MEKKKKKHVKTAEAPISIEEPQAPVADVPEEPAKEVSFPTLADIFKDVDPKNLEAAEGLGVPVKGLLLWARGMEVKQDAIIEALKKVPNVTEKGIAEELYKKSMEQRQQMTAGGGAPSTGNVGGAGGPGLGGVLQMIAPFLQGAGSNPVNDKIMELALEGLGLGNALVKAIILKTAPELATQLLPPVGAKP